MKKKLALLTIMIFVLGLLVSGCGQAKQTEDNSLKDIKQKGKFVVGLDDSFPPMGFKNDKGEIVGFDIDMAKEAAQRMGVKVEFKPVQWDGIILSLNNKDIDVIWNGLTITDKRKEQIDFSKVYLQNKQIIVVKNDSSIKTKKDLAGKVVGLQLGSSSETALAADTNTSKSLKETKKYSDNTEALMDLSQGRLDAVVVDEVVGRYYISKKPGLYKTLDEDFGKEDYGVGIRKTDKSFKEELDKTLDAMKADGTADKISQKWFGKNIITK
ncbi:amino acid ABC transporter substrate-binding protein [Clostridium thailandense]|uniref:Amino acid ABC transporter substrate-binding protein n=1 Tax=Clostridium thailandense TaxID=2794346 RepID=A0A949X4J2_9CLOT|nr:amino acid ABC transporter substrate-binding protein [Clostridium thailandense]MBV7274083.1 amino acid ABC transporter substrate-binding protein [Clostridium thailandense]MCH5137693.1 amino acid ABC transporter substrate-binding protein [Clostridiaceae bacterium UIB06]